MKKLLLFISTLVLSLFIVNSKTHAQSNPAITLKIPFNNIFGTIENANTYEYVVGFRFDLSMPMPDYFASDEYFFISDHNITLRKGINRNTNSYVFERVTRFETLGYGVIELRVTLTKTFVNNNYGSTDNIYRFFRDDSALYINYLADIDSVEYNLGYLDGFTDGSNEGYSQGYSAGYLDGLRTAPDEAYNKGYRDGANESFLASIGNWLVPAIIVVMLLGGFFTITRKKRDGDI